MLRKTTLAFIDPGIYTYIVKDTIGYNTLGLVNFREHVEITQYDTTIDISKIKYTKTFNGNITDSMYLYQNYDPITNMQTMTYHLVGQGKYFYGSAGENPDSVKLITYENGPVGEDNFLRLYYEDYNVTSIKKMEKNQSFSVYPNPFKNYITLDCKALENKNVTVVLTALNQQSIFC